MKPDKLRHFVKMAAEKIYYPRCLEAIEESLDPAFHSLARATLVYYLPRVIAALPTVQERRDAIDSIPDDADPSHTKDLVKIGVKMAWENREERRFGSATV